MISIPRLGAVAVAAAMVAGCAHQRAAAPAYGANGSYNNSGYNAGYYRNQQAPYQLGRVQSIEPIHVDGRTSGGGAVVGGAIGGLLGHQVDHGMRRDAATFAGVIAGA